MEQQSNNTSNQLQDENGIPQLKRKKKPVLWIILGVVVMIIAMTFAYFYGSYQASRNFLLSTVEQTYPADSIYVDGWASPEDYEKWKDAVFTIPQYNDIPMAFKRGMVKIFLDNGYLDKSTDDLYFLTKIKDRAPRVIAYGNFTGQGDKEMAFLLEKSDYESSAIFVIPQKGNILYWKKLDNELPTIKSFRKGALIYMDKMELVPAPNDGIIKQTKSSKYVLIYNQQSKTFDEYYQYTTQDIKNEENLEINDEPEEEVDTTAVQHQE